MAIMRQPPSSLLFHHGSSNWGLTLSVVVLPGPVRKEPEQGQCGRVVRAFQLQHSQSQSILLCHLASGNCRMKLPAPIPASQARWVS